MKKIEIKKMGVLNVMKVTVYVTIIPIVLCFLAGAVMLAAGVFLKNRQLMIMGAILAAGYPIGLIIIYELMAIFTVLIYNWLAGKFGGLELTIKETETSQPV
ncbi:MAG: hypothetical protein V1701_01330 [Planctomycetota bacterium]